MSLEFHCLFLKKCAGECKLWNKLITCLVRLECFNNKIWRVLIQKKIVQKILNCSWNVRECSNVVNLTNAGPGVIPRFLLLMESVCLLCKQVHLQAVDLWWRGWLWGWFGRERRRLWWVGSAQPRPAQWGGHVPQRDWEGNKNLQRLGGISSLSPQRQQIGSFLWFV